MGRKDKLLLIFVILGSVICFVTTTCIAVVKLTYPYSYNAEIKYYCQKYEVDESLVRAIIKVESGYNELAKSGVGAIGLMQIMPATAEWIATELCVDDYNQEMLFNPKTNIKFGCFYLNYLNEKYGDEHKVLFAYNAGEGILNKYYSPEQSLVIESIEIVETKAYINKVVKAKDVYNFLQNMVG